MCFFWSSPGGTSDKKKQKKKQTKTCLQTQETSEMQVQSLGQEDPLEEEMATHSNILAWRMPWTEEPGGLQFMGLQRVRHDWSDLAHMHICIFSSLNSISDF